jgi:hypothetical protein
MIGRSLDKPVNGMRLIGIDIGMNRQQVGSNIINVNVRLAVFDVGGIHDLLQ